MSVNLAVLWLHVVAVVVWMGGLMYQAHVLLPLARRGDAAAMAGAVARGRGVGWGALAVAVATGLYNVTTLGPMERAVQSGAALMVAVKLGLVLVVIALAAQRDWTRVPRLRAALAAGEDPASFLRAIAWLDRATLGLALVIVYLGLAISRA